MNVVLEELTVKLSNPVYQGKDYVITDADYNAIANVTKGKIDFSIYAKKTDLVGKVDKVNGKSLIEDTEILRLSTLHNYDDTQVRQLITSLTTIVEGKVDKVDGKQLSTNDFTNAEKTKLGNLKNYNIYVQGNALYIEEAGE